MPERKFFRMSSDIESGIEVNKQDQILEDQVHSDPTAGFTTGLWRWGLGILKFVFKIICLIVLAVLSPAILFVLLNLPKKSLYRFWIDGYDPKAESEGYPGIAGMYNKARMDKIWDRIMVRSAALFARISILTLMWLMLSLFNGRLKEVQILGSPMWKWSLLAVVLTAGFLVGMTVMGLVEAANQLFKTKITQTIDYYGEAMGTSIAVAAYFGVVTVTWLLYFRTSDGLKHPTIPNHDRVFDYVTWTVVSFFVGCLLWLFKGFLMAKWRADAIYCRLEHRIFIASLKYLFIGLCAAGFRENRLIEHLLGCYASANQEEDRNGDANTKKYSSKLRIMSQKMGLKQLRLANDILTSLVDIMIPLFDREDEEEEIITWFKQQLQFKDTTPTDTCIPIRLQKLFHNDKENDEEDLKLANVLFELVREESSSTNFTFQDFTMWMVDAHKDCKNTGRTLADSSAMVNCLDIFLSCIIFVIIALLWLLVTGVSSTTVLLTFATPILALTFMFGDTAKIFFQGIIFCFCTHPFDVGDRCILDETELEVKNVSILTTTFMKIGSKEKKLYPNAVLANEAIVNLGWQPDSKDSLVLTLDSSTKIKILEKKIKEFMIKNNSLFNEDSWEVMVKEVGDSTRVEIHFTHVFTIHDLSHNQSFKKKNKQKSYFLKKLKKYIKESQIEQVYPSKCDAPTTAMEIEESNT